MTRLPIKIGATLGAALGLMSLGLAAQASKKEFTTFVKLLTPKEAKAMEKKDVAFFQNLYAPDFKTKDEHGVENGKKVAMFLLRYHFNNLDKLKFQTKILSLKIEGNVGTVTVQTVLDGVTQPRPGAKGSPIKVTRLERRVFVKKGTQWLMVLDEDVKKPLVIQPSPQLLTPAKPATKGKA